MLEELGIHLDPRNPITHAELEVYLWDKSEGWSYGELVRYVKGTKNGPNGSVLMPYRYHRIMYIPLIGWQEPNYKNQAQCCFCGLQESRDFKGPIEEKIKTGGEWKEITEAGMCAGCGDQRIVHNILRDIEYDRWMSMKIEGSDNPIGRALILLNTISPLKLLPIWRTDTNGNQYRPWQRMKAVDYTLKASVDQIEYHAEAILENTKFLKKRNLI